MPRPGQVPPPDAQLVSYADPTSASRAISEKRALLARYGAALGAGKDRSSDPGVCIAAWLPPGIAKRLSIEGGVPAGELHVTLVYLGRRSKFEDHEVEQIKGVVGQVCDENPPVEFGVTGSSHFPPSESSDGKEVVYAAVESEGLMAFRRALASRLADAGFEVDDKHGGYVPHVTTAYIEPGTPRPALKVEGGPIKVPVREVTLAIGDEKTRFALGAKAARYSATAARAREVLGRAAPGRGGGRIPFDQSTERYGLPDSTAQFWSSVTKALPSIPQDNSWKEFRPSFNPGSVRVPVPSMPGGGGRTLSGTIGRILAQGRRIAGQLGEGDDRMAAARRGLAAEIARRKAGGTPPNQGSDKSPPGAGPAAVPAPRTPPSGSGPARAEAAATTRAPAATRPAPSAASSPVPSPTPDPRDRLPSQGRPDRTSDHTWADFPSDAPPAPFVPAAPTVGPSGRSATFVPPPPPARSGLPSQARPDRTSDLPETQPAGIPTSGQSVRGSVARQNAVSTSQAARKVWEAAFGQADSIGGRESRSGLQAQPGAAGVKPISAKPPVSASPARTRSQRDRSRDGANAIV